MKKLTFGVTDRLKQLQQLPWYRNEVMMKERSYPEFRTACQKIGIAPHKANMPSATRAENGTT